MLQTRPPVLSSFDLEGIASYIQAGQANVFPHTTQAAFVSPARPYPPSTPLSGLHSCFYDSSHLKPTAGCHVLGSLIVLKGILKHFT